MSESKPTAYERQLLKRIAKLENNIQEQQPRSSRILGFFRQLAVVVCVVLCALTINLSVLSIWLKRTVVNTNTWTAKTSEIMQSPAVQAQISNRLTTEIFAATNPEQFVTEALPPRLTPLAKPLTSSLESFTEQKITEALASDEFQTYWTNLNQSAHAGIVASLENGGKAPADTSNFIVYINNDQLLLNLQPVFAKIQTRLSDRGLSFVNSINPERLNKTVPITTIKSLPAVLQAFDFVNKSARVLPVLALVTGAVAFIISRNRRRTLIGLSITTAVLMVANVQSLYLARYPLLQKLSTTLANSSTQAAGDVYSILTSDLILYCRIVLLATLVICFLAWLTGNYKSAVLVRKTAQKLTTPKHYGPYIAWLTQHATVLIVTTSAIGLMLLALQPISNPWFLVGTSVIAILADLWLWSLKVTHKKVKA